jgi:hypothetical protein
MKLMPRANAARFVILTTILTIVACPVLCQTAQSTTPAPGIRTADTSVDHKAKGRSTAGNASRADSTADLGVVVFTEIELSPEGVTAYDTAGHRWTYNHGDEVFVFDREYDPGRRSAGSAESPAETIEPVERRCTERLEVSSGLAAKPVFVGYNEYVVGDIKAYDRVTVKGWVKGSIQSIKGRVLVTASGRVDGDIRAPEIDVKSGGTVLGGTYPTQALNIPVDVIASSFSSDGIWIVLGIALFLLLVAFLSVSLASGPLANIDECISGHWLRTLLVGLLTLFLLPLALALLVITVIGVLALPIVILVVIPLSLIAGIAASLRQVQQGITRGKRESPGYMFLSLVGVLVYAIFWMLVAILLGSSGGTEQGLGYFVLVVTILLTTYPLLTGVGAVVLTRFGFRKYKQVSRHLPLDGTAAPTPAPPPMPGISAPAAPSGEPGRGTPLKRPPSSGDVEGLSQ